MKSILESVEELYWKRVESVTQLVGYKLIFPRIPKTWIDGYVVVDLTSAWKKFGLDVTGIEWWTMGEVKDGISTRFDPAVKQYQSWLGGYLVKWNETRAWNFQDHLSLAVVDQLDWLRDYGDPAPVCELHPSGFKEIGTLEVSGYKGKLYLGGGITHSEVGSHNDGIRLHALADFISGLYKLSNPSLRLEGKNFIPSRPTANPYETVYVKGYALILDIEKDVKAVLYGCGAVRMDETTGVEVDTFQELKEEVLDTIQKMKIVPV